MTTWKQRAARRELGWCVAGLALGAWGLAIVYAPGRTLAITGVCVLVGACLLVTVANYLRLDGDPDFAAACGPERESDDYSLATAPGAPTPFGQYSRLAECPSCAEARGPLTVTVCDADGDVVWQGEQEAPAPTGGVTPTSPDWDGADGQLRLAVYACKRAGMSTPMVAQIVAHECAEYGVRANG